MIIVKYSPDGMKSVVAEDVTEDEFWSLFRSKQAHMAHAYPEEMEEGTVEVYSLKPELEFVIYDERLAASEKRYVARPDDWPRSNGEPL